MNVRNTRFFLVILIVTTTIDPLGFSRDYFVMLGLTLALSIFMFIKSKAALAPAQNAQPQESGKLTRWHGVLFLGAYTAYMIQLYLSSTAS